MNICIQIVDCLSEIVILLYDSICGSYSSVGNCRLDIKVLRVFSI